MAAATTAPRASGRQYDPDYYAAFVRDPDGNRIEAVTHQREEKDEFSQRQRSRRPSGDHRGREPRLRGRSAPLLRRRSVDAEGRASPARHLRAARPGGLPGGDRHRRQRAGAGLRARRPGARSSATRPRTSLVDEANAPEFFTSAPSSAGRRRRRARSTRASSPDAGRAGLRRRASSAARRRRITQATESGTVYRPRKSPRSPRPRTAMG